MHINCRERLCIRPEDKFAATSSTDTTIKSKDYKKEFEENLQTMELLGFQADQVIS